VTDIVLHVAGYPDSDDEERANLAWRLRDELFAQGIDSVGSPSVPPPPGAKGAAFEWAQLVVSVAGSAPAMIAALQGWLGRHPDAAVSLEIDGDTLTLGEASPEERRRLMETFLERHGAG
jgi:membrane-associated two-gene conflict system component 1 (EACC1)